MPSDDPSRERAFVARLSVDGSRLLYSTYLGGEEPSVRANGIAVDFEGSAYVTGSAGNPSYGISDVFVTKLTFDGSAFVYSVRFGGSGNDAAYGIAIDECAPPTGREIHVCASVTGATDSPDFPQFGSSRPRRSARRGGPGRRGTRAP